MRTVLRQGLLAACLLVCLSCSLAHAEQHMRGLKVQPGSAVKANSVFASDMAELKSFMDRQTSVNADTQATSQQSDEETQFGGRLLYRGIEYASFDRPLPDAVEKTLFKQFEEYFNQTQAFSAEGPNTFTPTGRQVVAVITNGRVSGVLGDVHNAQGDLLTSFSTVPEGSIPKKEAAAPCRRFKRLATAIQKYGHMYHHFVLEVLPRVILLRPYLDADTKVLLFGSAHEAKWLATLGIPASQVEVYDPSVEYCADELLVPSMSPIITPPKENYELLQAAFQAGVSSLDDESTDLIVYCSRRDAHDRVVANEAQLLALIRERYPTSELFVYTGRESVEETIRIFRRASVVVGMHGAGLSHIVFAPRGAAVVEFLFMPDPPMMFWHTASALQQHYIMVPLAQSWWLERSVTVPAQDVLDALAVALGAPQGDCPLGQYKWGGSNECVACPSGTYRPAGATSCMPCAPGRHSTQGAGFCSTCEADTYSDDSGFTCLACPNEAVTLFPGSSSASQCTSVEAAEAKMRAMFNDDVLASKLVDMPALENDKPKTAAGWLVAAMSPSHWQRIYLRKQLRQQYLKQLFNTDEAQAADEEWEDDEGSRRQMLQYGASRHMLQFDGYGSHHRHMLQWDGYSHRRSVLQFGYHRRRHMLQYH